MDLRSQPHEQRWLRASVLSNIMLVSIPNDSKCCAAQTFAQHLKASRCAEGRLPPSLTWSWWRHLVRNSLFRHLCFCFRSKHLFFVSDHMISFKTPFFQHLCFCFRSKQHFFVSDHMISLGSKTTKTTICLNYYTNIRNSFEKQKNDCYSHHIH
jgi:hypothetical protein